MSSENFGTNTPPAIKDEQKVEVTHIAESMTRQELFVDGKRLCEKKRKKIVQNKEEVANEKSIDDRKYTVHR